MNIIVDNDLIHNYKSGIPILYHALKLDIFIDYSIFKIRISNVIAL